MISSRGEWQRARDIYHAENKESGNYNSVQTDVNSIMRVFFSFTFQSFILYSHQSYYSANWAPSRRSISRPSGFTLAKHPHTHTHHATGGRSKLSG